MTRMTVYHLGRSGNVAGGMTQTINDYLAWEFPTSEHRLVTTRSVSHLRSLVAASAAWRTISRIPVASGSVVVAHLSQGGSFVREGGLAMHAFRRGLPVVAQVHGSSFDRFAGRHPRLARQVLSNAHVIQVLSESTRAAVERLGVPGEVAYVPNAVAGAPASPKENLVVFGGAVTRRKGVDVLLEAWSTVATPGDWRLVIAGPHIEPELVSSLPASVTAPGALERDDLLALLSRARIAVLPSLAEAMPLFILEALASSTAVIATPVGGVPDVISPMTGTAATGVLVPPGDSAALASALAGLMTEDSRRESIATEGHRRWESTYSNTAIMPQLEQLWRRASDLRNKATASGASPA